MMSEAFGYKIWTVQESELMAKVPRKCLFQDRWLKDIAYQEWVLKDKLDKHYTQNLILVRTNPYTVLIWL